MTYSLPGAHTTEQPVKDFKKKSLQIKGGLGFGSQCLSETGLTNTEAHGEGYVEAAPVFSFVPAFFKQRTPRPGTRGEKADCRTLLMTLNSPFAMYRGITLVALGPRCSEGKTSRGTASSQCTRPLRCISCSHSSPRPSPTAAAEGCAFPLPPHKQ